MGELGRDLVAIAVALVLLTSAWYGLFAAREPRWLAEDLADSRAASVELVRLPR
jgi:hypothetical protein